MLNCLERCFLVALHLAVLDAGPIVEECTRSVVFSHYVACSLQRPHFAFSAERFKSATLCCR